MAQSFSLIIEIAESFYLCEWKFSRNDAVSLQDCSVLFKDLKWGSKKGNIFFTTSEILIYNKTFNESEKINQNLYSN